MGHIWLECLNRRYVLLLEPRLTKMASRWVFDSHDDQPLIVTAVLIDDLSVFICRSMYPISSLMDDVIDVHRCYGHF